MNSYANPTKNSIGLQMTFCGWELFLLIAGGYLRQQMQVLDIVPISLAENMLHAINLRIDYKGRWHAG